MTVIACRDGVVAADTGMWHGEICRGTVEKIWRLKDGSIFAGAGRMSLVHRVYKWLDDGLSLPEVTAGDANDGDIDAIWLKADGSIWCIDHRYLPFQSGSNIEAAGSHHEFLYGAMMAGASAEEAVRLAIKHCNYASGEVRVERLHSSRLAVLKGPPKSMGWAV